MIRSAYPSIDEKGNPIFESLTFGVGVLRTALEPPFHKHYHPEPTNDEFIDFLNEIHIQWETEDDNVTPIKSLIAIKKHQLNAEFQLHLLQLYLLTHC